MMDCELKKAIYTQGYHDALDAFQALLIEESKKNKYFPKRMLQAMTEKTIKVLKESI